MAQQIKRKKSPEKSPKKNQVLKDKKLRGNKFLLPAILLVFTFLIFSNSIRNDFINLDDPQYVTKNQLIQDLSVTSVGKIFSSFTYGHYQPLPVMTYAIDAHLWGMNPSGFRTINILLHIANVLLVFYFIMGLTHRREAAFIAALLFAVHPLRVETVVWIAERKDVLYGLFYLIALLWYVKYHKSGYRFKFLALTFLFFGLSLFSKAMAVTLPVILLLIDFYFRRKFNTRTLSEKIPFFILSLVFGFIAIKAQSSAELIQDVLVKFNYADRFFLISYSVMIYLLKIFFPFQLVFMTDYPDKTGGLLPFQYYIAPVILLLIIIAIVKAGRFRRELVFGTLFYLITISLVLQIIPVAGYLWDHYTYLPSIGIFFIIGKFYIDVADHRFSYSKTIKRPFQVVLLVYLIFISVSTWSRNKVWVDSETLFTDVINKIPDSEAGYNNRGLARIEAENYRDAIDDFTTAIELKPNYDMAYHNRARAREEGGDLDGAMADINMAVKLAPAYAPSYNLRGLIKGKMNDHQAAISDFSQAISIDPRLHDAYSNRGQAYAYIGEYQQALKDLDKAIEIFPDYGIAYGIRGSVKFRMGDNAGACNDWARSAALGTNQSQNLIQKYCR